MKWRRGRVGGFPMNPEDLSKALGSAVVNGYEEDWREYRRIRNRFVVLFVAYVPVCFSIAIVSVKLFHTLTLGFVATFVWMALVAVGGIRVNLWRCPNCGERFSGTWWYNLSFLARRCVHCGLQKYSNTPPQQQRRIG
jgi:hypothetical protein